MRILEEQIKNSIASLDNFVYCFEINLSCNKSLFLTSCSNAINIAGTEFLPNSGLSLKEGSFNDLAKNFILLEGIFESGGIDNRVDLTGAEIKIFIKFPESYYHFLTYYCTAYTKYDLSFTIYLESETVKYNQSLLHCFSKTCRANFGDDKCKINKALYEHIYEISEITGNSLSIKDFDKENGYFNEGTAVFSNNEFCARIISNYQNNIELDRVIPDAVKQCKHIKLIAGCDKKFISCCNKFDNAVNFRGEPLIPEYSLLKIK